MTTQTTIGNNGTTVSPTLLDTMNGTSSSSSSSSTSSATSGSDLQNTFLQLLIAQMKNQDPTNPMDSSQMTSQLAEINTVTGISQLNTSLTSLATQLSASQQPQASLLIGSTVLTPGSTVSVASGKGTPFGLQFTSDASNVQVSVKNSAGQIVETINLGSVKAGSTPFSWTPSDASGTALPDGNYTISATGTVNGKAGTATTLSASTVASVVQQADGSTGLLLSNGSTIGLTQVGAIL
ncbi:flagellar hook assembly protein FlgD [Paraburkholderia flava]|uniref:flagellar hook assembly protein FlgD n=1 Tax=Paraburkholderia flava TaxID=2547393 RepID=UPI00105CDE50|nr:flagellar hook assembly protein FlgD [Paraburkholderia flava]